jgi:hypothetical protein
MNKTNKKLGLRKETVRTLDGGALGGARGGMKPLTFGTNCPTANCQTLGELCNPTNNCMTLGTQCDTHDCQLTFTSCAC